LCVGANKTTDRYRHVDSQDLQQIIKPRNHHRL